MPRFVVLEHDHPVLHWDLLLEAGAALQAWRLAQAPVSEGCVIEATALPAHRLLYLDYEGPVSGARGTVRRWDAGVFDEENDSLQDARKLCMQGARVRGRVRLERLEGTRWRFQFISATATPP